MTIKEAKDLLKNYKTELDEHISVRPDCGLKHIHGDVANFIEACITAATLVERESKCKHTCHFATPNCTECNKVVQDD